MAIVIANGRPSGTATMTIEIPIVKYLKILYRVSRDKSEVSESNIT